MGTLLRVKFLLLAMVFGFLVFSAQNSEAQSSGGLGGVQQLDAHKGSDNCIPDSLQAQIQQKVVLQTGGGASLMPTTPLQYSFVPMGGTLDSDIFENNFVDLDPSGGIQDFSCNIITYNGHTGIDIDIRSFAEQVIGVPVFAVADGTVSAAADGNPDMNTSGTAAPANYVVIDHGGGRTTSYFHLKMGSVSVTVGQQVFSGQQIGMVGSSGISTGPHLHFETQDNFVPHEVYSGPCNTTPSGWGPQPVLNLNPKAIDFGATSQNLSASPFFPYSPPRDAQIVGGGPLFLWLQGENLPANSTYNISLYRPSGVLEYSTGNSPYSPFYYRVFASWWWFTLPNLQAFPGTWHVKIEINSQQVVYVPIEVVLTPTPNFNRPPAPISAHLEPADPSPDRAVFCRVDTDPVMDDLDWDLLQYRYQWRVNGNIVRDNVFAGHADALRKGAFNLGDTVQCTVTANDGHVNGTPVSVQAVAQSHPWLDLGFAKYRSSGVPHLEASGPLVGGVPITLSITQAQPSGFVYLFWSLWAGYTPAFGATMVPTFIADPIVIPTDAAGNATLTFPWFYGFASGIPLYIQAWSIENPLPPYEVSTTNGIVGTMP